MALPEEKLPKQQSAPVDVDITKEYVIGMGAFSSRIGQVLSNFADDLQWIVGVDVYERMARDPTVSKNIQFQKLSVQSEGVQLHPAISKPKASETDQHKLQEYQLAQEIRDFHQRSIEGLHRPITQIIGEMLVALKRSHSVAEITYKEPVATGSDPYKLLLKSIKVKPRNTTAFVIDTYRNVLGLTAWLYGTNQLLPAAKMANGQQLVPLEKFAVLAFETEDEDPRGINPLRAAYNFWQAKCLVPGLHLKWLEKSGVPSTVGTTAEKAQYEQIDGEVVKSPQEAMAESLALLESGASAAFPYGAKVAQIEVSGTGAQFTRCYLDFDTQIDYAMVLQSGATKDSKSGSYASKRIFKDVLDILIWSRKHTVAQVLQGVLKNGTHYNFGEENVYLTPIVMIGDEEGRDWARDATALAAIASYLTDSQWDSLCAELGIPTPIADELRPARTKATPTAQSGDTTGADNQSPSD